MIIEQTATQRFELKTIAFTLNLKHAISVRKPELEIPYCLLILNT